MILDGETYAGKQNELRDALLETRKKGDPKFKESFEKALAEAEAEITAKEPQDPNPQTASE